MNLTLIIISIYILIILVVIMIKTPFLKFMKRWGVGIKDFANSTEGTLQSQIIINSFIIFGLLLGILERSARGDTFLAWLFFCIALLQLTSMPTLIKAYKGAVQQRKIMKKLEEEGLVKSMNEVINGL
jgi:hypothetical protein